ncbi:hypothetical protein CK203_037975 [Vitis vinifera]|uniref:Disease resistance protein At4g27190-like leucine-rich repeats domain-containing protein n=1 Tax=Vitis vinifera TaxID=29760 RepID=A0A438HNQ4_VITVI|nr:hypothetical protein CK203_037975 [Vitis vinifera]
MARAISSGVLLQTKGSEYIERGSPTEGLVDEENHFRALARLRELELNDLPELKYLWKENSNVGPHFQNLEILKYGIVTTLMNLVPSSVSFHNLASLDISYCCSLINLLPPLIAKSLVQHKIFKIGVYSLSFPVLERVVVEECPKMKIFSQGLLVTPRLDRVEVGNNKGGIGRMTLTPLSTCYLTHGFGHCIDFSNSFVISIMAIVILRLWNWELLQQCDYTMSSSCATSLLLLSSCGVEEIVAKENGIENNA